MTSFGNNPTLSVLIPAYEYARGVERIIGSGKSRKGNVEFIVHDDSTSSDVECAVRARQRPLLHYRWNKPALGAVKNWNSLLDAASGRYVMLVHHDEFPLRADAFEALAQYIEDAPDDTDLFLLPLELCPSGSTRTFSLIPNRLRAWLLFNYPGYLMRQNFIGPTATLILRRDIAPRFDPNLVWLVDVDFYLKTLARVTTKHFLRDFTIVSETNRSASITAGLDSELGAIRRREAAVLLGLHGKAWGKPRLVLYRASAPLWYGARLIGRYSRGRKCTPPEVEL